MKQCLTFSLILLALITIAVVQDLDDTVYLYATDGNLLAGHRCDTFGGSYLVRQDGVLLVAEGNDSINAIDSEGRELFSYHGIGDISCIDILPDDRIVVFTSRHVTLLSDQGKLVWSRKLAGEYNCGFVNDGQWIDCIVREGGGLFDFEALIDFTAKYDRPRYLFRYDLDGHQQGCWALPLRTWGVYGPGPAGHYYLYQDDERSEYPHYYPVDFMQIRLPHTGSS